MLDQEAIPGSRGVDGDGRDLPLLELKAKLTGRVLVQRQCSLERSGKSIITFSFLWTFHFFIFHLFNSGFKNRSQCNNNFMSKTKPFLARSHDRNISALVFFHLICSNLLKHVM